MTTAPDRRTAHERGIRMGNRVVPDTEPRISQLISATIHLASEQDLRVDTYGSRAQRGGHIAVASDSLLIYLHDRKSAKVYADAWIDAWYIASHLPKQVPTEPRTDTGPVMMARADGSDDVQHVHDTARGVALIRIGRLTWLLHDQAAWATTTATWRQVADIAPLVLALRNTRPAGTPSSPPTAPASPGGAAGTTVPAIRGQLPRTRTGCHGSRDRPVTPPHEELSTIGGRHPQSPVAGCGHPAGPAKVTLMYQVSVTTRMTPTAPIPCADLDAAVETLRVGLATAVAPGRRILWVIRCPTGRLVRGDITINTPTADPDAAVADHVAYVRDVLDGEHRSLTDPAPPDEGV